MNRSSFLGSVAAVALTLSPQLARAQEGIDACGNIHVEAQAQCEVIPPSVDCESMCTPVAVRASCEAQVVATCDGRCNELPSVACSGQCVADCAAQCSLDPGEFDCHGACEADCSGHCTAGCAASADEAACMAMCEGDCSASCDASCDVELPEADCDGRCEASCEGSCEVDANLDCRVDCQVDAQGNCEAEVTGGCRLDCESEQGALFCDGQYVDHGDNLEECLDALRNLDVNVEAEAHGSAQGEASASCGVAPSATGAPNLLTWSALGVLLTLARRRSR